MATNPQPASQKELKLLTAKFQQLLAKVAENRPTDDLEIIRKAYDFSLKHHQGQTRASGEPYLIHPLEVVTGAGGHEAGFHGHLRRAAA